jgi:Uma2 family endonuclease
MGNLASPESLLARWQEVQQDPALRDLPYKIELNAWGKVEMSPASVNHGRLQLALGAELRQQLSDGVAMTECPILTDIGVRVPDVVWASAGFMTRHAGQSPLPRAPEICAEILAPTNVEAEIEAKKRAYFAAGALEVWIIAENGSLRVFGSGGDLATSRYSVTIALPDLTKGYQKR